MHNAHFRVCSMLELEKLTREASASLEQRQTELNNKLKARYLLALRHNVRA